MTLPPAPASTLVSRVRQRLSQPWSQTSGVAPRSDLARLPAAPPVPVSRRAGFQASIAEFLLVSRLRARRGAEPSADVLERAARIVFVTCKNWFAAAGNGHGAGDRHTRI